MSLTTLKVANENRNLVKNKGKQIKILQDISWFCSVYLDAYEGHYCHDV